MRKKILIVFVLLLFIAGSAAGYFAYLLTVRVEGDYLDVDGVKIHYTDEGAGFPLILIHGIGANADLNWRRPGVTARLAHNFRVISLDLRGHGLSDRPTEPRDYGLHLIEDVHRLMDHLQIEKAHIAGYSLGGFLTLKFVALHPDRVQSAAFCASGWANVSSVDDVLSPYRLPPPESVEQIRKLADTTPPFVFGAMKDWFKGYIEDITINKPSKRAMKKSYPEIQVTPEDLAKIITPCICFMGTEDGLVPYAVSLKEKMPDLEFVVLEGEGHMSTAISSVFKSRLEQFFLDHTPAPETVAATGQQADAPQAQ